MSRVILCAFLCLASAGEVQQPLASDNEQSCSSVGCSIDQPVANKDQEQCKFGVCPRKGSAILQKKRNTSQQFGAEDDSFNSKQKRPAKMGKGRTASVKTRYLVSEVESGTKAVEYVTLQGGVNGCTNGTVIASKEECYQAATFFGVTVKEVDVNYIPSNCVFVPATDLAGSVPSSRRREIRWNSHSSGRANRDGAPVCYSQAPPTASPTAPPATPEPPEPAEADEDEDEEEDGAGDGEEEDEDEDEEEAEPSLYQEWVQGQPFGGDPKYITCNELQYGRKASMLAYVCAPNCQAPSEKLNGIVVVPGKSPDRWKFLYWCEQLAYRGFVAACVQKGGAWDKTIKKSKDVTIEDGIAWMKGQGAAEYNINQDTVTVLGYSVGAEQVNKYFINGGGATTAAMYISVAGIRNWTQKKYKPSGPTGSSNPAYLAFQAADDHFMGFNAAERVVRNVGDWNGGRSYGVFYTWSGHHPMQQTNYFSEIERFVRDPDGYELPPPISPGSIFTNGSIPTEFREKHRGKGCYKNNEGIKPIEGMEINTWGGANAAPVCQGYCKQVQGCNAIEVLGKKRLQTKKVVKVNCVLYEKACDNPLHKHDPDVVVYEMVDPYTGPYKMPFCTTR